MILVWAMMMRRVIGFFLVWAMMMRLAIIPRLGYDDEACDWLWFLVWAMMMRHVETSGLLRLDLVMIW